MIDLSDYCLEDIEIIHYALELRIDDLLEHIDNFNIKIDNLNNSIDNYNDMIITLQNFDDKLSDYIEENLL